MGISSSASLAAVSVLLFAACGGGAPTMKGRQGMLDESGVKEKCAEAAKKEQRPFIVDWDATDVSSFERKAARDTVVVRYEGCKLEILPQCSDPDRSAAFGSYPNPQLTSSGLKQVDIKNEGELFAKLPLGVVSFGGKVSAGEELHHVKYFVTGEAATTRESISRGELKKFPGCEGATHFVYAYNVGAFELFTTEKGSAEVGASTPGAAVGGKKSNQTSKLGKSGNIASCETNDQRECRVPLRLTLREITEGEAPAGSGAAPTTAVIGGSVVDITKRIDLSKTASGEARGNIEEAIKKFEGRDGASCMRLIDKAITKDKTLASGNIMQVRALCQMLVGECEPGAKAFRAAVVSGDTKREISDDQLAKRVNDAKMGYCPASSAGGNDADFFDKATGEAGQAIGRKDVTTCKGLFDKVMSRAGKLTRGSELHTKASGALGTAALCIIQGSSCKEGAPYMVKVQVFGGVDQKNAELTIANAIKQGAYSCK